MYYLFQHYGDYRALHSLPTRRSSDLVLLLDLEGPARLMRRLDTLARDARRTRVSSRRDRKSTRLNSSHRCISYAVFCLKKKKTYAIEDVEMKWKQHIQR